MLSKYLHFNKLKNIKFFIILSLASFQNCYADYNDLCKKFKEHSINNMICSNANKNWSEFNEIKKDVIVISDKIVDKDAVKILILSPKVSNAYDISSYTIINDLIKKDHSNYMFVLYNFMGNYKLAKYALSLAEKESFDLVVSMGSSTSSFINKNYNNINNLLPVVTACSKDPVTLGLVNKNINKSLSNIAYTSLNIPVSTQVSYIREKFFIRLKRIAVIYDQLNKSSIVTQVEPLKKYLSNQSDIEFIPIKVNFKDLNSTLYSNIKNVVNSTVTDGDTVFLITGSTELFGKINEINSVAKNIPVLSVTPSHVAKGKNSVFMAIGVSFETNAKLVSDYVFRILNKMDKPGDLAVGVVSTPDISFNFMHKPNKNLKIPFDFFEDAGFIYSYLGDPVRLYGKILNE